MTHPAAVYRCFAADDALLYVGQTSQPLARISAHVRREWEPQISRVELTWFPDRASAAAAEKAAIQTEAPRFNIVHRPYPPRRWPRYGHFVLRAWLEATQTSVEELADRTGLPAGKLRRYLDGTLHATRRAPYAIEKATGGGVHYGVWGSGWKYTREAFTQVAPYLSAEDLAAAPAGAA